MRLRPGILFLLLLQLCIFTTVSADLTLSVGPDAAYQSISQALLSLPGNAGKVTLQIAASLNDTADAVLSLPTGKSITSLTIEGESGNTEISLPAVYHLYANGIPFFLGEHVAMDNAWIFGGMYADYGKIGQVDSTQVVINGSAAYVFGGGAAFDGGSSIVKDQSTVELGETGRVYWELFGGGLASGEGSYAAVNRTQVEINGSTDYALAGGLAQQGGASAVTTQSSIAVSETGAVQIALFGGGSAVGSGSAYQSQDTFAMISGSAGWAFGGDFVYQGAASFLNGTAEISVTESGSVRALYGGSFATDENSRAAFNQTQVSNLGAAGTISESGEQSNGGISTGTHSSD